MKSGVYLVFCMENAKVYIGSAVNIRERWQLHRSRLRAGKHCNPHLQNAWDKYGEDKFTWHVILRCEKAELIENEQAELDRFRAADPECGFNICKTAGSTLGCKRTEETKVKMSESRRGNARCVGYRHTDEARAKIGAAARGNTNWLGHALTPEHRQKIGEAQLGRTLTPEHCQKISKALRGKPKSPEHCQKLSEANRGKTNTLGYKHTDETKAKLSAAIKAWWAAKKAAAGLAGEPIEC